MQEELRVTVGEYEVVCSAVSVKTYYRGEEWLSEWRDSSVGDDFLRALAQEVNRLRTESSSYWKKVYEEEVGQLKRLLTEAGYPVTPSFFTGFNQLVAEVKELRKQVYDSVMDYLVMNTQAEEAYQKQLEAEKRVKELEELCAEGGLVVDPDCGESDAQAR